MMALKWPFDINIFNGLTVLVLVLQNNFCHSTIHIMHMYVIGEQC